MEFGRDGFVLRRGERKCAGSGVCGNSNCVMRVFMCECKWKCDYYISQIAKLFYDIIKKSEKW